MFVERGMRGEENAREDVNGRIGDERVNMVFWEWNEQSILHDQD